jgi:hypothetical protein
VTLTKCTAPDNYAANVVSLFDVIREAPCLFDGEVAKRRPGWAMMLKLTASNGKPLWVNPPSIRAVRHPVELELKDDKAVKAVIFVADLGWHVINTPEEIIKALEKY